MIPIKKEMNMKKRILMAGIMAVTALSVLAGAYAFFTDKKDIKVSATAAKLGITVDKTKFSDDLVANMVPGDTRDLVYTIKKEAGSKDAIVFSEVTLKSSIPMSDPVEWYIQMTGKNLSPEEIKKLQDEAKANAGGGTMNDIPLSSVSTANSLKFLSLSSDKKEAKFIVGHGTLSDQANGIPVNLTLKLSPSAGNSFTGGTCDVAAEIYAIQKDNLEQDGAATNIAYIRSLVLSNEGS